MRNAKSTSVNVSHGLKNSLSLAMQRKTLVSVVIPSFQRHNEVIRAVKSALDQTLAPLEVIVSNDGEDRKKAVLLLKLNDDRIRYVQAPPRRNASATRNYGIQQAKGNWVALLDDDDVWLPEKLASQFDALKSNNAENAILAGVETVYFRGRSYYSRPHIRTTYCGPASELLFAGYGGVNTSTLLARRSLFEEYPFDEELDVYEDWKWMLQAGQEVPVIVAPEIICRRRFAPGEGLSRPGGYKFSRRWYENNRSLMTVVARAGYVAHVLSRTAAFDRKVSTLPWLIGELRRNRGFQPKHLARMAMPWLLPTKIRRIIKVGMRGMPLFPKHLL